MAAYEGAAAKVTGIRQIVRLKGILQKWHSNTSKSRRSSSSSTSSKGHGDISPVITNRLRNTYTSTACDSDEETINSHDEFPVDVPRGFLAVYVGPELRRFIIPTSYLSLPVFKVLLEKVEEEFGFDNKGGLTIPCEIETFKYLLTCMETHNKDQPPAEC
ncbi:PREDICTED: uncharacterized protein LOC104609396 [Nelumbo nucifera]|uniref:Uncharacterized protein n=2 Tax=Nelumbo nucifera TaxID=4432 RepID=A0A823A019_NELNU|nr:PREDICTED: uncharacterized protein LOC104609396 [Nelumbo nucifera]DAD49121.1 TPA_asm: hypothetical protein HUJ06_019058 [Nelumbo nucifera]